MALFGRAVLEVLAAVVIARSSATITWNSRAPSPPPPRSEVTRRIQSARVSGVQGTRVSLRLSDGSTRLFIATPVQARMLERMIGTVIRFRAR